MSKKILVCSAFIIFTFGIVSVSMAQKEEVKTKKEMLVDARNALDNTVWKIDLTEMSAKTGKKMEAESDTLRFENNKIISDKLTEEGFPSTGYTVRLKGKDNEIVIWETMQTSEEKGIAFWRGKISNEKMRGVLSWHIDEKKKKDYTFSGSCTGKEVVSEEIEEVKEEIVEAEPVEIEKPKVKEEVIKQPKVEVKVEAAFVPVQEVDVKKEKNKKKGWFSR